jgi:hypothetical protein
VWPANCSLSIDGSQTTLKAGPRRGATAARGESMSQFRHPHLVRGIVHTPQGQFSICRGLVEMPDAAGESLGWLRADGDNGGDTGAPGRGSDPIRKVTYWHRDLPPLDADAMDEHTLEATSIRVPGTLGHRDELWDRCREDLMAQANARLEQEVARLGGDYAHVLGESIDSRRDDAAGEAWLHGRFTYMLYRVPGRVPLLH